MNFKLAMILVFGLSPLQTWARSNKSVGKDQVALIELYTSESCSSCPPADKWISNLIEQPGLWSKFVPVVFHVDYWNHLNWKDRLSTSKASERQRRIAQTWSHPSVYTPGLVLNGKEYREWRRQKFPSILSQSSQVSLQLTILRPNEVRLTWEGLSKGDVFTMNYALLGFGLKTDVKSGENSGKRLVHDFAVLNWDQKELDNSKKSSLYQVPIIKNAPTKLGLAVWIERKGSPIPIQAAGSFLSN
ncbi:MAG: DUF1223 domain-containing protein [Bdellovibrionales bacterium]|nr:DUF1223 domain-containing protein [Bdellovibrionales bacterium]